MARESRYWKRSEFLPAWRRPEEVVGQSNRGVAYTNSGNVSWAQVGS